MRETQVGVVLSPRSRSSKARVAVASVKLEGWLWSPASQGKIWQRGLSDGYARIQDENAGADAIVSVSAGGLRVTEED